MCGGVCKSVPCACEKCNRLGNLPAFLLDHCPSPRRGNKSSLVTRRGRAQAGGGYEGRMRKKVASPCPSLGTHRKGGGRQARAEDTTEVKAFSMPAAALHSPP